MNNTATLTDLKKIMGDGRFATVTFKKVKDNSIRVLNGRLGVRKDVNGRGNPSDVVLRVYEVQGGKVGQWRSIRPETVLKVVANRAVYQFASQVTASFIIDTVWEGNGVVRVTIHSNGKTRDYRYLDVPYDVYYTFANSSSKGTFYNKAIKPYFTVQKS